MAECPATWKIKHAAREYAEKALARLLERDARRGIKRRMHVYLCNECYSYHVGYDAGMWPQRFWKMRQEMWVSQKGRCGLCGEEMNWGPEGRDWNIDHIVPRSKGGTWARENLQITHKHCNHAKADLHPLPALPLGEQEGGSSCG